MEKNKNNIKNDNKIDDKPDKTEEEELIDSADINLILNSFEYYDKNNDKNKNKLINVKYISIEMSENDLEYNNMIFYDSNRKEIYKSRFERIGLFEHKTQIWSWAWTLSYLKKNETNIIRKILFYGTELDSTKSSFLKT